MADSGVVGIAGFCFFLPALEVLWVGNLPASGARMSLAAEVDALEVALANVVVNDVVGEVTTAAFGVVENGLLFIEEGRKQRVVFSPGMIDGVDIGGLATG